MKRMHAAILIPVVLLLNEGKNIPVNSDQGKKIAAVFKAVKEKKPIPYYFTVYVDGNFFGSILSVNNNDITSIELFSHNADKMAVYYSIKDDIEEGAYRFQTY